MRRGKGIHSFAGLATIAVASILAGPSLACGYEDPQSIAIGALNLAFPDSLHLRTAMWQAQVDGVLPREQSLSAAPAPALASTPRSFAVAISPAPAISGQTTDPTQMIALMAALQVIEQARSRLATSVDVSHPPPISMVYASKMLWTRFVATEQGVSAQTHASGPESGDVVLITEPQVIQAVVAGSLKPDEAVRRNLLRLYGDEAATVSAQQWLMALAPPATTLVN